MKKILFTGIISAFSFFMPRAAEAYTRCFYPTPTGSAFATNCTCQGLGFMDNGTFNDRPETDGQRACISKKCRAPVKSGQVGCKTCVSGYYVKGNLCEICPTGATCYGGSPICPSGTFLSADRSRCANCDPACKTCLRNGPEGCLSCNDGYFQDSPASSNGDRLCSKCISSCKTCSRNFHTCTSCEPGHYLLQNGTCRICGSMCNTCSDNTGACTSCRDGSKPVNGQCAMCPPGCRTCSGSGNSCTVCISGSYLSNGQCRTCPPGATCDGIAAVCAAGQYFNGSSCSACAPECATCSGSRSSCLSCKEGYFSSSSPQSDGTRFCAPCPIGCRTCLAGGACTMCTNGYYIQETSCSPCPENAVCDGSKTIACNAGFTLTGSQCIKSKVASCPSRMTLSSDKCCCVNK